MKNLSKVSTPNKVLFIGLGILAVGIVVLVIGLLQSPAIWKALQCGYDLSLNNSTLTRDQISEYCSNNQTLKTENTEDLITIGFGIILLIIGLIIIGIGGIWLIVRRRGRREATEEVSATEERLSSEMMINNNRQQQKEDDYGFTPKKSTAYCIIVGLTSAPFSIFITSLILLSTAAFVFVSITLWYMFGDKFH